MDVRSIPVSATLRLTDLQDEAIQSFHRIRPGITRDEGESVLSAVQVIRNAPVGNGFLTITNELRAV